MRKELSLLAILLVFGAAFSLSYNLVSIKDTGYPGDVLKYNLSITNNGNKASAVSIFLPTAAMYTVTPNNFQLQPGQTKNVQITYTIPLNAQPGNYFLAIRVNGQNTNMHIQITILRPESEYQKITVTSIRGTTFDPRKGTSLLVEINNPVAPVNGKIVLITPFGNQTKNVYLQKGIDKVLFNLNINPKTTPKNYPIEITTYIHGIEKKYNSQLTILGYSTCNVKEYKTSNWLEKSVKYVITNNGTTNGTCFVKTYISNFDKLFLGSISNNYYISGNEYLWKVSVGPNETKTIEYTVSYYAIYLAAGVAVAAVVIYIILSKKVKVRKSLIEYKKGKGFMDLKLQISVKNMKNKTLHDVVVLEHIPTLVRDVKEFGTMKGEITKINGKRYIKWTIDELKPKEEVFISYKVRTSLEVIGDLVFDPTKVKFKYNGKERESKSNTLIISTE